MTAGIVQVYPLISKATSKWYNDLIKTTFPFCITNFYLSVKRHGQANIEKFLLALSLWNKKLKNQFQKDKNLSFIKNLFSNFSLQLPWPNTLVLHYILANVTKPVRAVKCKPLFWKPKPTYIHCDIKYTYTHV